MMAKTSATKNGLDELIRRRMRAQERGLILMEVPLASGETEEVRLDARDIRGSHEKLGEVMDRMNEDDRVSMVWQSLVRLVKEETSKVQMMKEASDVMDGMDKEIRRLKRESVLIAVGSVVSLVFVAMSMIWGGL